MVGLAIRGSRISGCLLNRFDNALRSRAALQGLGGISLGMCEALTIVDNGIERNSDAILHRATALEVEIEGAAGHENRDPAARPHHR